MKQNKLIETANVRKAQNMIQYLLTRPVEEMVGLGMIYGPPGLGKSRFAKKHALEHGWIYLRLESTMTAKAFLLRLVELLQYKNIGTNPPKPSAPANDQLRWVLNTLAHTEVHIMIDEIDYAFGNHKLLGAIRDIVDETFCAVILIGMGDAKERLGKQNAHYFDRCNAFVEFKPFSKAEAAKYLSNVSDIHLTGTQKENIFVASGGKKRNNVRRMIKHLRVEETKASLKQVNSSQSEDKSA